MNRIKHENSLIDGSNATSSTRVHAYVAAAEDVILGKLLYYQDGGSEKHVREITGIPVRSGHHLNRPYLDRHADPLGAEEEWRSILLKLGLT